MIIASLITLITLTFLIPIAHERLVGSGEGVSFDEIWERSWPVNETDAPVETLFDPVLDWSITEGHERQDDDYDTRP